MSTSTKKQLKLQQCASSLIDELFNTRRVPLESGQTVPMDVYIPREQGDYLYSLIRHTCPQLTVEIGMANGLSTLFITQALQDNGIGRHIAIDPFQRSEWHGAGLALIGKAKLESLVELREQYSHQALPDLEREDCKADFIFIDGSHLFDYVISDFLCCDRILNVNGLIAFDDSDWPAVRTAIRFVLANRHYEVAFPQVVIEKSPNTPTLLAQSVRKAGAMIPRFGEKLRPDFMTPCEDLKIRGRCVVLRKIGTDDRDSQSRFHHPF